MDESMDTQAKPMGLIVVAVIVLAAGGMWHFTRPDPAEAPDTPARQTRADLIQIEQGLTGIDEARAITEALKLRSSTGVEVDALRGMVESR